ncbi:phosphorylase [Pelagibius litoralis]|uniref:Phosphorylase n=1 Tax=Pelagibius litoralis TaxID=374515 RepID=A0A967KAG0_9PROT|nr:phosphorylase [Pelagibius litoralis]NIA69839.1 phosphorylase [Pelagibius litoralis]
MSARPAKLGIITGLAAEARLIAGGIGISVVCAGADSARAEKLAGQMLAEGATALMSFGIAGALDPRLTAGDLILAETVVTPGGQRHPCDRVWLQAVSENLREGGAVAIGGSILGSAKVLLSTNDKAAAFAASACQAVDMESHAVAAVAARSGVPFLALRAIADMAGDALPSFVTKVVTSEGEPDRLKASAALLRRPWDLPAALRLSRRTDRALATLQSLGQETEVLFGGFG